MKTPTIFDILNQIYYKKNNIKYDKKIVNGYMLTQWLSHDKSLIDIVNKMNQYQFYLDDDLIYKYYFSKVPKGGRYIKWTKKIPVNKKDKKELEYIMLHHNLSKNEAKMLLSHKKELK